MFKRLRTGLAETLAPIFITLTFPRCPHIFGKYRPFHLWRDEAGYILQNIVLFRLDSVRLYVPSSKKSDLYDYSTALYVQNVTKFNGLMNDNLSLGYCC
jgi:hypothetical protein